MSSHTVFSYVHFIGVGGVGMSGLATILLDRGVRVSGTDAADSPTLERLARRGARICVGHAAGHLPAEAGLVVYSSAVTEENPEYAEAVRRGLRLLRRGAFLAELAAQYPVVVSVGGSHGKTTTTAMIAHILRETGRRPGYLIGGDMPGWAAPAAAGAGEILVTEVDESDGTQALMRSSHAVVTNVDDDHCWSLGGVEALERCFITFAERAVTLFCHDDAVAMRLFKKHPRAHLVGEASIPTGLELPVPGMHNRKNAALALAVTDSLGVPHDAAVRALGSFHGVSRRLSERYVSPGGREVVVEDYAHHPNELAASVQGLRERYPGRRLTVIFQPHRFERVKRYAAEFSRILEEVADEVFLIPPFAAWMQDRELADPRRIVTDIRKTPATYWEKPLEELATLLADTAGAAEMGDGNLTLGTRAAGELYAVIGAGDVGRLAGLLKTRLAENWLDDRLGELRRVPELAGCRVARDKVWSELTTLGAGLARPLVAYPETLAQLQAVLRFAAAAAAPVAVLGAGSNLVGADWEPPRLWVCLRQGEFRGGDCRRPSEDDGGAGDAPPAAMLWRVGCGVTLRSLFEATAHAGLPCAELAPLAWIPGTVGGAVVMNAGADGASIGRFVTALEGVRLDGTPWEGTCGEGGTVGFFYRGSSIPADVMITAATLRLPVAPLAETETRLRETGDARRAKQPAGHSAGCVFRNPAADIPAGKLIDRAGCKGMVMGGATVSDLHANFIVTDGRVSEKEFLNLLLRVRQRVFTQTGVVLMPEVRFAGAEAEKAVRESLPVPRVVVLKGGPSSEREVSLRSGAAVAAALREAGCEVTEVEFSSRELPPLPAQFDVVFPVLHGEFGEDGQIQALMDARGIRYVGSGASACRVIMDKVATKDLLLKHNLPTPKYARLKDAAAPVPSGLRFPVVVKPDGQGSSIGISIIETPDPAAWRKALEAAFALSDTVFAEEFVKGAEITVSVLHGKALPVVEIRPPGGRMYDYDAKYEYKYGKTEYFCPPERVSPAAQAEAQRLAEQIARVLEAKDMIRIDFIVDAAGTPWCLEGNAIPGCTATSLLPKAARAAGISFPELCAGLVRANL